MNESDLLQVLQALGAASPQQQNPMTQQMQLMQQQNPAGYLSGLSNPNVKSMMRQQNQQPSWLDALNQTLMMGNMAPQQQPFNPYSMGGMGMMGGNQQPSNWWQKGLQGTGSFLSGAAQPATNLGAAGLSMGIPHALPVAIGGVAAGGLGNLFQYLGQPGQQQMPTNQGGWS